MAEIADCFAKSSWCLEIVLWLFLAVPWVCLQFVIVVFPDHIHLLFSYFSIIKLVLASVKLLKPLEPKLKLVSIRQKRS